MEHFPCEIIRLISTFLTSDPIVSSIINTHDELFLIEKRKQLIHDLRIGIHLSYSNEILSDIRKHQCKPVPISLWKEMENNGLWSTALYFFSSSFVQKRMFMTATTGFVFHDQDVLFVYAVKSGLRNGYLAFYEMRIDSSTEYSDVLKYVIPFQL